MKYLDKQDYGAFSSFYIIIIPKHLKTDFAKNQLKALKKEGGTILKRGGETKLGSGFWK